MIYIINADLECWWVKLYYTHKPPILIGAFYRLQSNSLRKLNQISSWLPLITKVASY